MEGGLRLGRSTFHIMQQFLTFFAFWEWLRRDFLLTLLNNKQVISATEYEYRLLLYPNWKMKDKLTNVFIQHYSWYSVTRFQIYYKRGIISKRFNSTLSSLYCFRNLNVFRFFKLLDYKVACLVSSLTFTADNIVSLFLIYGISTTFSQLSDYQMILNSWCVLSQRYEAARQLRANAFQIIFY